MARASSTSSDMDIDLFSDAESSSNTSSDEEMERTPDATECIEDLVASFLFQLSTGNKTAPRHTTSDAEDAEEPDDDAVGGNAKKAIELRLADRTKGIVDGTPALKTMRYPMKRQTGSARPFAQLFKVLDLMHEAVTADLPATKRDIYYRDVPLFKTQKVVDNLVDDVAATFALERADLNIRATSKGLVCGSGLVIHLKSGEEVHGNDTEGTLVPVGEDIESFTLSDDVDWVLLVEKDAVFQTLCRVRMANHPALSGRGLIITGKGYPDLATRELVATLSEWLPPRIPILGLVDGDPFGLDILSVYKYGSRAMQHEGAKLTAGRVKYLGVFASELARYGVDRDALLPITKHDEKKALSMLRRTEQMPAKWRKELMHMLHSRRKAETEILAAATTPLLSRNFDSPASSLASTPPLSQDTDCALVRYLIEKIEGYVEIAQRRSEASSSAE